jgi:hypothetical protein
MTMDAKRKTILFRQANDTIDELLQRFGADEEGRFFCECGNVLCARRLAVTTAEYEAIRARGAFLVAPECIGSARVVERTDRYAVVVCFRTVLAPVIA